MVGHFFYQLCSNLYLVKPWNYNTNRNNISCHISDVACRWLVVESAKLFQSYVQHFWIFICERNCRIFIGFCKKAFFNDPIIFLDRDKKKKLMPASFSYFLELLCEKKVTLSSMIVITVIISLHYKETD